MIAGQRVVAVVAARGGSKGIPGKNLRAVGGKPLIAWTIEAAQGSRLVDRTILSSDDDEIIAVARACGCEAPFKRPAELARDDTPGIAPVLHAVDVVRGFDVVVLLQPTSPLRTAFDVDSCLEQMVSSGASTCVSVCEAESHPYLAFEILQGGVLRSFIADKCVANLRRQEFPRAWRLNGAIYAAQIPWLVKSRTFIGADTTGYPMPVARSLDIDTFEDLAIADAALSRIREPVPAGSNA